jgi:tryptophan-rich sensory protein
MGGLTILTALALIPPLMAYMASGKEDAAVPLSLVVFFVLLGLGFCFSARGIRRNSWEWGLVAIMLSISVIAVHMFQRWDHMAVAALLNIIFLVSGWNRLGAEK